MNNIKLKKCNSHIFLFILIFLILITFVLIFYNKLIDTEAAHKRSIIKYLSTISSSYKRGLP